MLLKKNLPIVIAEISGNHNGSLEKAKKLILESAKAGADYVKIQTYTAESMTINSRKKDFLITHGPWKGYSLYELYKQAQTPLEWQEKLYKFAKKNNIKLFSSVFDEEGVNLLESLEVPIYKIASFEITDLPLIEYVSSKKKPIILSTGTANENEISEAIKVAKSAGSKKIILLHCISSYPANFEDYNLLSIKYYKKKFKLPVGLSDHTKDFKAALIATALGAEVIEKHIILNKNDKSTDSFFSNDPKEFKEMVGSVKSVKKSLGKENFKRSRSELKNKVFRRSIYFTQNIKKGEIITSEHIKRVRPGYSLSPKYFLKIIGRKLLKDVKKGQRLSWSIIK
ncbi:pseudaminic acid synthase [Alphaproteobacteria bacterium]|nr:pseudaminic acid synthase [Alphaproteobacteria bacterium]